jgi:predicted PurR-regulated permease PerM
MADIPPSPPRDGDSLLPFLRRAALVVAIISVVGLLLILRDIVLLVFAAVMVGVALTAAANAVSKVSRLGHRTSLAIATALTVILIGGSLVFIWPIFQEQLPNLFDRIMVALGDLEDRIGVTLPENIRELTDSLGGFADQVLAGMLSLAGAVASALAAFLLVAVAGVFFAAEPQRYRDGVVLLFPMDLHGKVRRAMRQSGEGLLLWLRAHVIGMLTVGVLVGLGAWAIGLPSSLALGLIAGLAEFVPIIGPFIAFVPAALVAFGESTSLLGWTVLLYFVVQQLEGNVVTPLLQRNIVSMPPVLLLFSMVAFAFIFGVAGVIVAAPLTVTLYLLVRQLYVRDLLGQEALIDEVGKENGLATKP